MKNPDLRINVRIFKDTFTLSLDSSGHFLHRRGYRTSGLEKHRRIREAVQFVKQNDSLWDDAKYRFFIKYLNDFPKEAESYFTRRIDPELLHTGDRHYYAIADSLRVLKKIDRDKAIAIAQQIRNEYKRREI